MVASVLIAALYDIHGNIDALKAVLSDLEAEAIDLIVIGGDIAWGAFPAEAVALIQSLGERAKVIRGNADREVLSPAPSEEPDWIDEVNVWCLEQLTPQQRTFLDSLPLTESVTTSFGEALFCHATPTSDEEIFTAITPEGDVRALLGDAQQELIMCGHTHSQFDRRVGQHRVINAGSVGMPYEDQPGAYWAIIGDEVEFRRSEYDYAAAAERTLMSDCPHGETFANGIISPPAKDEATKRFEDLRPKN